MIIIHNHHHVLENKVFSYEMDAFLCNQPSPILLYAEKE